MADHCCPWWLNYVIGSPLRRWMQPPEQLFGGLVEPGMTVLDAGCGMGVFTLDLARMVGEGGKVVAVDLQRQNLTALERKARRQGLADRITTVVCDMGVLPVGGKKFDFALAANSVHEVPQFERFFTRLHELLVPDGRFLFLEPSFHVDEEEFQRELALAAAAGLELVERREGIRRSRSALLRNST